MPGEEEPKVKRRVGTAFCLSEEVFKRPVDSVSFLYHLIFQIPLEYWNLNGAFHSFRNIRCLKTTSM